MKQELRPLVRIYSMVSAVAYFSSSAYRNKKIDFNILPVIVNFILTNYSYALYDDVTFCVHCIHSVQTLYDVQAIARA